MSLPLATNPINHIKGFVVTIIGKRKGSFVSNMLSTMPWHHYDKNPDKAFCFLGVESYYKEQKLVDLCREKPFAIVYLMVSETG